MNPKANKNWQAKNDHHRPSISFWCFCRLPNEPSPANPLRPCAAPQELTGQVLPCARACFGPEAARDGQLRGVASEMALDEIWCKFINHPYIISNYIKFISYISKSYVLEGWQIWQCLIHPHFFEDALTCSSQHWSPTSKSLAYPTRFWLSHNKVNLSLDVISTYASSPYSSNSQGYWGFLKWGYPQIMHILAGFSLVNHPFWYPHDYGNPHIEGTKNWKNSLQSQPWHAVHRPMPTR